MIDVARRAVLRRLAGASLAAGGLAACGGGAGGSSGATGGQSTAISFSGATTEVPALRDTPRPAFDVREFGAQADGRTNDLTAVRAALAAAVAQPGSDLVFPAGTYWFGELAGPTELLAVAGATDLRIVGDGATLVCTSTAGISTFFLVESSSNVRWQGLAFRDDGLDRSKTWQGAVAIWLSGHRFGGVRDVTVTDCRFDSVLSALTAGGAPYEVTGIVLDRIVIRDGYYGLNFQDNGNRVQVSDFLAEGLLRTYFAYGVNDHVISVTDRGHPSNTNNFLIKCYARETANITLQARCTGPRRGEAVVVLEHQQESGSGVMRNVRIDLDLEDTGCALGSVFLLRALHADDQIIARTDSVWRDISIDGTLRYCHPATAFFTAQSEPAERALVRIGPRVAPELLAVVPPPGFDFVRTA